MSATKVAAVLHQVPGTIRGLVEEVSQLRQENEGLREKVAHVELQKRAENIARMMDEKGFDTDVPYEDKVAEIMLNPHITALEEGVKRASGQTGISLAQFSDEPSGTSSNSREALELFLLGLEVRTHLVRPVPSQARHCRQQCLDLR